MCNLNNSCMSLSLISSDIFPTCNISTSLLRLAENNKFLVLYLLFLFQRVLDFVFENFANWCFVVSDDDDDDDDDDNDDDDNPGDVAVDVDSILLFIQEVLPVV